MCELYERRWGQVRGREERTCVALPVELTENEKATEYDEDVEYGNKHGGHGLF